MTEKIEKSLQDARTALNESAFGQALDLTTGLLVTHPGNFQARRVFVEAAASLGMAEKVVQAIEGAGHRKAELLEVSIRRAGQQRHLEAARKIHTYGKDGDFAKFESTLALVRAGIAGKDRNMLREVFANGKFQADERKFLRSEILIGRAQYDESIQILKSIETGSPQREASLRRLIYLGQTLRNSKLTADTGYQLLMEIDGIALRESYLVARAAEDAGLLDLMQQALRRAESDAALVRDDRILLRRSFRIFLNYSLATFAWDDVAAALSRVERQWLPDLEERVLDIKRDVEAIDPDLEHVSEARAALIQGGILRGNSQRHHRPVELCLPAERFSLFSEEQLNLNSDIRKLCVHFATAIKAKGRGFGLAIRLGYESAGESDDDTASISYHTRGFGRRGLHFKEADQPHMFSVDSAGYAGWSELTDRQRLESNLSRIDLPAAQSFFEAEQKKVFGANISKYKQRELESPAEPLPARYIFVALQVLRDSVQQLAYIPMLEMLDMMVDRMRGTHIDVVVKRHPLCTDVEVEEAINRVAKRPYVTARDDSVHRLIAGSMGVFTVNSTVGLEALLHLKPVYLFGKAEFGFACHEIKNAEQLEKKIDPIAPAVGDDVIKKFLFFYRKHYLVDVGDPAALDNRLGSEVEGLCRPRN
jgi:hypothetical protein